MRACHLGRRAAGGIGRFRYKARAEAGCQRTKAGVGCRRPKAGAGRRPSAGFGCRRERGRGFLRREGSAAGRRRRGRRTLRIRLAGGRPSSGFGTWRRFGVGLFLGARLRKRVGGTWPNKTTTDEGIGYGILCPEGLGRTTDNLDESRLRWTPGRGHTAIFGWLGRRRTSCITLQRLAVGPPARIRGVNSLADMHDGQTRYTGHRCGFRNENWKREWKSGGGVIPSSRRTPGSVPGQAEGFGHSPSVLFPSTDLCKVLYAFANWIPHTRIPPRRGN